MDVAENITEKYRDTIESLNLGLIGVSEKKVKKYIKPKKNEAMKPYIRLMNLVISNDAYTEEAAS